jgi:hypothetical protein
MTLTPSGGNGASMWLTKKYGVGVLLVVEAVGSAPVV